MRPLTAVNQVLIQSNRFHEIMQRTRDEQKSQMRDFCRSRPFHEIRRSQDRFR